MIYITNLLITITDGFTRSEAVSSSRASDSIVPNNAIGKEIVPKALQQAILSGGNALRKALLSFIILSSTLTLSAQNAAVIQQIEANNTTLKALRAATDEQKLENQTGLWLSNPELAFNYLWGSPRNVGDRKDFSISQPFDIQTLSGVKRRIAADRNLLAELEYSAQRLDILLEARQLCIDAIYCNARKHELEARVRHAVELEEAYRKKLDSGDANILEYNKIQLSLSVMQGELSKLEIERNTLSASLKRLNGGIEITTETLNYEDAPLPSDFETWYAQAEQRSPVLQYVRREVELKHKEVSSSKMKGLPELSAGYMSEKVVGQQYQGLMLGISIPLWENRNNVRRARAAVHAAELREYDARQQFYARLQALYAEAAAYARLYADYRKAATPATPATPATSATSANLNAILLKAFNSGALSLLEYLITLEQSYELTDNLLEAQWRYHRAIVSFNYML
jgi:outer membrane protein TolC